MITMTEFIEKVDAIMCQKNMDDKKTNQLCHLYAMIFKNGYNACVEETAVWLKAMLWKNPKTRQEELVQAARKEYPEWKEAQCHFIDGARWADEHPSLHVVASLMHLLRSGRIDTTTTNADVLTQLQIELKNRDKTNQSKAL